MHQVDAWAFERLAVEAQLAKSRMAKGPRFNGGHKDRTCRVSPPGGFQDRCLTN